MTEIEDLSDDYEHDVVAHLAKQPHDLSAGWLIVLLFVLVAAVGVGLEEFLGIGAYRPPQATAMGGGGPPQTASVPLAEELGLFVKRGK